MMMLRMLLLLCAFVLSMTDAQAAARAWLDRPTIEFGETVTLNVEVDGVLGSQPDLSPLARDFRVVGSSSSSQVSIVNGQRSIRTLWAVALQPLAEGVVGIPALAVGGASTEPLTLTVRPAATVASAGAGDDAFLEVEADLLDPYVQQQVRYTVRLFYAVQLLEGQLDEPQPDGARIQRIGNDATYQRMIAGRRYQVVERRYAVSADHSGTLEIPAPRFRGRALGRSMFGSGQVLQATGDAVSLTVRPRPPSAPRPWLPAADLQLQDESGALPDTVRVGEPLTLSLRVTALGLLAEQLPELELGEIAGAQVYPDRESSQTREVDDWFRGERTRRFAIVPAQAGTLDLPSVQVSWWNTRTDRLEVAELPSRRVQVLPAASAPAAIDPMQGVAGSNDAPATGVQAPAAARPWQVASLLLLLLWLATLAWAWRNRRPVAVVVEAEPGDAVLARQLSRHHAQALDAALRGGDPRRIASALRAACPGQPCADLAAVATHLQDPAQADAVDALERALYAEGDTAASVDALQHAFASGPHWRVAAADGEPMDVLPPLYR
jgi:hypothetical protein